MRNSSGHQCKVKMSRSETKSEQEHIRHFLQKMCTKKFLELSRCSHTKSNGKEMYKKKCAARAKMLFC